MEVNQIIYKLHSLDVLLEQYKMQAEEAGFPLSTIDLSVPSFPLTNYNEVQTYIIYF